MGAETQKDLLISKSLVYSSINASINESEGEGVAEARAPLSFPCGFLGGKWPNNRLAPLPLGLAPHN